MPTPAVKIFESANAEADVAKAALILEAGGLVVLPTETVYGVAARLDRPAALARLAALRGPATAAKSSPWTPHLARPEQAWDFVFADNELSRRLVKKLWPGPVGLIFDVPADTRKDIADRLDVAASDLFDNGTITLRCPDHPLFAEIVGRVSAPVALTKVDGGGATLPATFDCEQAGVDMAIDAGPTRFSKPSTLLRVHADRYEIVRAGVFDQRIIERQLRTTVLFVCSGNTCRSPMAEALARKIIADAVGGEAEMDAKGYAVASAGVFAMSGTRATPQAVEAVAAMGADLSKHRSKSLTPELLHAADVVLVMGRQHEWSVRTMSAAAPVKMLDPANEIEDPIGADVATYRALAEKMRPLIRARLREGQIIS